MILALFIKQVIWPDFQAFGQVERKFNNSLVYAGLRQILVLKPNSSNFISTSRKGSESVAFSTVNFTYCDFYSVVIKSIVILQCCLIFRFFFSLDFTAEKV